MFIFPLNKYIFLKNKYIFPWTANQSANQSISANQSTRYMETLL